MELEKFVGYDSIHVSCPTCGSALALESVRFPGMPIIVDACCGSCGHRYEFDWPAGHALLHPVIFDIDTQTAHLDGKSWYATRFLHCVSTRQHPLSVPVKVCGAARQSDEAVLVDCLDFLYGHSLLKLLSAPRYLREDRFRDLVLIVPKSIAWLVPARARVIEVDIPFRRGDEWIEGLETAVEELLAPYRRVSISPAISQPEVTADDLAALGPGFAPSMFWTSDDQTQVSFILRDDRLWLGTRTPTLAIARRVLGSSMKRGLELRRQQREFAELARILHRRRPDLRLVAMGIGSRGGLPSFVDDLRSRNPTPADELRWVGEYAKSRVIVGVHGSNMLLPSALGGAVVELLPRGKLQDIAEDLIVPSDGKEPKLYLFRYRILPETTAPSVVADTTISILDHAAFHHQNIVENKNAYEAPGWRRGINWRPLGGPAALRVTPLAGRPAQRLRAKRAS